MVQSGVWIPVDCGTAPIMPEKTGEVWVTRGGMGEVWVQSINYYKGLGYFDWDGILAWMPWQDEKPEPYKIKWAGGFEPKYV